MDIQHIIDILLATIMAVIGFFAKQVQQDTRAASKDLSDFKQYVALNHPTHDGINRRFDKVDENLNRLGDKMDENIKTVVYKIDSMLSHNKRRDDMGE